MGKVKLENWPIVDGRYEVGNKESPVAIFTNASIDVIKVDMSKVAIIGKCVTENIGLEKVIENIVANPNIRFLLLCGKSSKGHFTGEALIALRDNGLAEDRKIIGAKGNMPYLKNISDELIDRFLSQITLIDMIEEEDSNKIMEKVDELLKKYPGAFIGETIKIERVKEVKAERHKDFIQDPNGYFVVIADKKRYMIIVEYYKAGKLELKILGKDNEEVRDIIGKLNLVGNFERKVEHANYLGREVYKAELALKYDLNYEQDKELDFGKLIKKENKEENKKEDFGWYD